MQSAEWKVTLVDVARAANVATSTVSRALGDDARITPRVRARVRAAARRLGYTPNVLARGLSGQGSRIVAFAVPPTAAYDAFGEMHLSTLRGVSKVITDAGRLLLLSLGERRRYADLIASGLCEGLIIATNRVGDPEIKELDRRRMPVVLVPGDSSLKLPCVNFENRNAAIFATHQLLTAGHRRIAFLGGTEASLFHTERAKGFHEAMRTAGLKVTKGMVRHTNFSEAGGFEEGLKLLTSAGRPTAVVCVNDLVAYGLLTACRELGLQVPSQISVVSASGAPEASPTAPRLSRSISDFARAGTLAASLLFRLLDDPSMRGTEIRVPVHFEAGASIAPPPPVNGP